MSKKPRDRPRVAPLEDMPRSVEELTPEEAGKARGGAKSRLTYTITGPTSSTGTLLDSERAVSKLP